MRVVDEVDERAAPPAAESRTSQFEILPLLSYLALGVFVLLRLWISPAARVLAANDDDHGFFLFVMAHGERVLFSGDNPLFTGRLNVPDGVNMMANTSVLAISVPLAPVTHWLGPGVSVVLALTLGLAGTAAAWYYVFSRHLVGNRFAAWLGGLWCGFSPAMVSHANGHVNFVSQFVVPFIVWQVLRLREPGRVLRGGILLGLLIVLQVFVNEEVLLFTALALGVFVLAYALMRPRVAREVWRRFLGGLAVAAGLSGVLLSYPLYFQFTGPGSYRGQPFEAGKYVTDLLSIGAYARQSLAGNAAVADRLTVSATEENTFFGVPLVILLVVLVVLLRRQVAARAVAIAFVVMLLVSMGPNLRVGGVTTGIPLPFGLVSRVPIIDLISVTRFGMVTATLVGVLLALAAGRPSLRGSLWFRVGLIVALLPVLPKPLPVVDATPLPPFLSQGMWHSYVPAGRSLVPVPLPDVTSGREGMRWAALSHLEVGVPRGYFMGPAGPPADRTGSWNAPLRPTARLLWQVQRDGVVPSLTDADRQAATADLIYWRASVVVLVPGAQNADQLRQVISGLLGRAPQPVGGTQVWDVRDLPVPPTE